MIRLFCWILKHTKFLIQFKSFSGRPKKKIHVPCISLYRDKGVVRGSGLGHGPGLRLDLSEESDKGSNKENERNGETSSNSCRTQLEKFLSILNELGSTDVIEAEDSKSKETWDIREASALYAKEIRSLCFSSGNQGVAAGSRLLQRYFETLNSLLRFELKKVLNVCMCGETERGNYLPYSDMKGLEEIFSDMPDEDAKEAMKCCSSLFIVPETGPMIFNNDDPAALLHSALEKYYIHKPALDELHSKLSEEIGNTPKGKREMQEGA